MIAIFKRSFLHRWRTWLSLALLTSALLATYILLPYFGMGRGITEANGRRIQTGMTRSEVEAIMGRPPNPFPGLAQKGEALWDAYNILGSRYASVHVVYDTHERVVSTHVKGFWRNSSWLKIW